MNVWKLNDKGLEYDREWMIVKRSGICLTQKLKPTLCMINPKLDLVNKTLTLTYGAGRYVNSKNISVQNITGHVTAPNSQNNFNKLKNSL